MTSATGASPFAHSRRDSRRYSPRRVPGTRRLLSKIHHGRPSLIRKRPALAGRQVDERKFRCGRTGERDGAADRLHKVQHRMVARQHQMVAVVDRHADGAVEIGPAAAARIGGGFVHDDLRRRRRQLHRGCKAREACTDNVDGCGSSDDGVLYRDPGQPQRTDAHARSRGLPPARHHALQHDAIDLFHDPRRFHGAARVARHDHVGLMEM